MAELDEMLRGRPGTADVVDRDRGEVGQGARVDQDDRAPARRISSMSG